MTKTHPLVFLAVRTLINGIVRSFNSPMRAIATIFFLGWNGYFFLRFLTQMGNSRRIPEIFNVAIQVPGTEVIAAAVFGLSLIFSMIWAQTLFTVPLGFQSADADVLFPTPVKSQHILIFKVLRTTLVSLLVPLIAYIFMLKPGANFTATMARGEVSLDEATGIFQHAIAVMFLCSFGWMIWRYASILMTAGTELSRERRKRAFEWGLLLYDLCLIGAIGFMIWRAQAEVGAVTASIETLANRITWLLYPPAGLTAATILGVGPVPGLSIAGLASMVLLIALGGFLALRNSNRICELGRGSIELFVKQKAARDVARGLSNREVKVKSGSDLATKFLSRYQFRGENAFVWRELIYVWRLHGFSYLTMGIAWIGVVVLFAWSFSRRGSLGEMQNDGMTAIVSGFHLFFQFIATSMFCQTGIREFLRKTDLIRPLPLTSSKLLFNENLSRAALTSPLALISLIVVTVIQPEFAATIPFLLAAGIGGSFLVAAATSLAAILLPDVDDPTQKQFRSMISGLGVLFFVFVVLGVFAGFVFWTRQVVVAALACGIISAVLGALLNRVCVAAYAKYGENS